MRNDAQHAAMMLALRRAGTGVCVDCGSPDVINPEIQRAICMDCLEKRHIYLAAYRKTDAGKIAIKANRDVQQPKAQAIRAARIAQGLCATNKCIRSIVPGRKMCQECLNYFRLAVKKNADKKKLERS